MSGDIDIVEALETTEKDWNEATDRLGRADQAEAWREIKKWYPNFTLAGPVYTEENIHLLA